MHPAHDVCSVSNCIKQIESPANFFAGLGYRIFRFFIVATALTPDAHNVYIIREKQHDKQAK
jgi:hypothetical protein